MLAFLCLSQCRQQVLQEPASSPQREEGQPSSTKSDDSKNNSLAGAEAAALRGPHERFYVELGDAPSRGSTDAPVTMVVFADFECPFCQRGHQTVMQLEREYQGQLRLVYKAFPLEFHPYAMLAALAARSAQSQGKFWEFYDLLLSQPGLDLDRIYQAAQQANLDLEALVTDLNALTHAPTVRREMRQAKRLGVRGTPAYFINGRALSGAKPIAEMRTIIEEELERAQTWRDRGIAPADMYSFAIADGYRAVEYRQGNTGLREDLIYKVPLADSPQRGPATAPVTIVEFGDFECPYCVRGNATLEKIRAHYGDKLRIVYKHHPLPFHRHAYLAARASAAAHAEGKFWEFHDRLYQENAQFDEDTLLEIAKSIGLDLRLFKQALRSDQYDSGIGKDQMLAHELGVDGTPTFFVNGRPLQGAVPELEFRMAIEEELERAEALLAKGVEHHQLYEQLTTNATNVGPIEKRRKRVSE